MQISVSAVDLVQADDQSICWNDSMVYEFIVAGKIQKSHSFMIFFYGKKHYTGIRRALGIKKGHKI